MTTGGGGGGGAPEGGGGAADGDANYRVKALLKEGMESAQRRHRGASSGAGERVATNNDSAMMSSQLKNLAVIKEKNKNQQQ